MPEITHESFLEDVRNHEMMVVVDNGVHRHLKFNDGSPFFAFEIVTFPGYLVVVGDMGSFTFCRLRDMFEFFRRPDGGKINPHYWGEKVEASDRHGGIRVFNEDKFKANVLREVRERLELEDGDPIPEELSDRLEDEVFIDECAELLYDRIRSFEYPGLNFNDFWEVDSNEWHPRFLWICYAIVWAISMYDKSKEQPHA